MVPFLSALDAFFWGPGTLALLVGTGVFLTLRTHFLPLRDLGWAIRTALGRDARQQKSSGGISPFSALMTALAATVGTGNIVGVATALTAGGPGALVWMELAALAGLSTKFAECLLAVKYRARSHQGGYRGGPMYVLHRRLGLRRLGAVYALFTLLASFGIGGMVQSNAIAQALEASFAVPAPAAGAATAILALLVLLRGGRAVASVSAALVPGMALVYLSAGTAVIAGHLDRLPEALGTMLRCAFSPGAVAGGGLGSAVSALDAARWGVARGVFSNESGLGSAAISAAAAATHSPVRQGYISMTSTFFDTCLVCTVTGLAICCSGVLGQADGAALTLLAFRSVLGRTGEVLVSLSIALFAFSSILGWAFQGETAAGFLLGERSVRPYHLLLAAAVAWGAGQRTEVVFLLSDLANALMCLPNLFCLLCLSGEVARDALAFQPLIRPKKRKFSGMTLHFPWKMI